MIYADSGIIMRWVEGASQVRDPIELRWRQLPQADRVFVTSRMARLECRCKPLQDHQDDLLHLYEIFFASKEVDIREVDAVVVVVQLARLSRAVSVNYGRFPLIRTASPTLATS